jgi:hypothetical protein
MGTKFPFCEMKSSKNGWWTWEWQHHIVKVLNVTELSGRMVKIVLCYVYFTTT